MHVPSMLALVFSGLFTVSLAAVEAGSPAGESLAFRQRAGVSSTTGGVTHAAGVNAGLDQRAGFDLGISVADRRQSGREASRQYGHRQDERWFAGARGGVQAGAFADARASQSGRVGQVEIENYVEGETFVGSEAGVEAGVSNNGLGLGANAFSGGRVSGSLGTNIGSAGVATTGEAWSGVGAEAGINVKMKQGKLTLGGELGAALGVGGKLGAEITIDTKPVGQAARKVGRFAGENGKKVAKTTSKVSQNVSKHVGRTGRHVGQHVNRAGKTVGKKLGKAGKTAGRKIVALLKKK